MSRHIPLGLIDPEDECTCPIDCVCRNSQTKRCERVVGGRCACGCVKASAIGGAPPAPGR
jgi:hypothetical protein